MRDSRYGNQMIHAWCGPACVVGTVISLVLIARLIPPPPAYLSALQVVTLYREHLLSIRFGLFIAIAATALLIPFSAVISIQMMRKEGGRPVLAFTQLAGGATGALVLIVAFMVMMMAAFDPERPIEITKAIHDMGWLMLLLPYSPFCVQYIVIAMLVLQDTSERPLFPRWTAYFNIWIAISFIPTGLVGFFKTGPFTWHGLIGFWIPLISYGTWFMVMFFALRAAIRDDIRQSDTRVRGGSA
jgi:hypothetical protein